MVVRALGVQLCASNSHAPPPIHTPRTKETRQPTIREAEEAFRLDRIAPRIASVDVSKTMSPGAAGDPVDPHPVALEIKQSAFGSSDR
jgi:hypothetical protein